MSEPSKSVQEAQEELLRITTDLVELDGRLAAVVESIEPHASPLRCELSGGTQCVRTDLLRDAIDTLHALGLQTEEGALARHSEIADSFEQLTIFA